MLESDCAVLFQQMQNLERLCQQAARVHGKTMDKHFWLMSGIMWDVIAIAKPCYGVEVHPDRLAVWVNGTLYPVKINEKTIQAMSSEMYDCSVLFLDDDQITPDELLRGHWNEL